MFKKTITFEDFNGNKQTEDFYFHISKAEFLALSANGDEMKTRIERITKAMDGMAIINELRAIIKLACGVRSEDGSRFIKDTEAQSTLLDSPAFDELLMELATDSAVCSDFIQKLVPEKMQKEMLEQLQKQQKSAAATYEDGSSKPAYVQENRQPTQAELMTMSRDELVQAMAWKQKQL
jgi:hypothetical protein